MSDEPIELGQVPEGSTPEEEYRNLFDSGLSDYEAREAIWGHE